MAWVTILAIEATTGPRPVVTITPPAQAEKFAYRVPRSEASNLDQRQKGEVRVEWVTVGSAVRSARPIDRITFQGEPDNAPNTFPGTGSPVDFLPRDTGTEVLDFNLLHYHEDDAPSPEFGLQVMWFDANNVELDGTGNVDPNPVWGT